MSRYLLIAMPRWSMISLRQLKQSSSSLSRFGIFVDKSGCCADDRVG